MIEYALGMLLVVLVVTGTALFYATHVAVKKFINVDNRVPERKKHLWAWRVLLLTMISYSAFVVIGNREVLSAYFPGPMAVLLVIALTIYFFAFVEIIAIDLFLPAHMAFWKRAAVEASVFILLCVISYFAFKGGLDIIFYYFA